MKLSFAGYLDQFYAGLGRRPQLRLHSGHGSGEGRIWIKRGIKYCTYTHIGDIMDSDNKEMIDFQDSLVRKYIELLKETDIPLATQTPGVKQRLIDLLDRDNITVLPEPYFEPSLIYTTKQGTKGVLMIGSNYRRKNYQKMFDVLAITGLPATVVCAQDTDIDGNKLIDMALKSGVNGFRIINNIPNEYIHTVIKSHRCLLHLSEIEVLPYAVLESLQHIPCIINGKAPWSKDFPFQGSHHC